MTYGFALNQQFELILYALGFGFLLGLLYRFITTVRQEISKKKCAVIAGDVFFSVIATVLIFCFLLVYADGQVRLAAILANALGFAFYMITADFILKNLLSYTIKLVVSLFKLMLKPFSALYGVLKKLTVNTKEKVIEMKKQKEKSKVQKASESKKNKKRD